MGLGVVYGKFSHDLQAAQQLAEAFRPFVGAHDYKLVLESFYRVRMGIGAVHLQPDLRSIVNPGGAHQYSNALVSGAQAGATR